MKRDECPADLGADSTGIPSVEQSTCESDPDQCLAKCNGGSGPHCFALARVIQDNDSIENDVADVLFRNACRFGIASGCTNAAAPLSASDNSEAIKCSARAFEITCANGDPWGCSMDGMMRMEGSGRDVDLEGAKRSFERTCELAKAMNYDEPCEKANALRAIAEGQEETKR